MLSLAALGLLWITGMVLVILYTVDEDQSPSKSRRKAEPSARGKATGLGGELSRLEARFEGGDLEIARAIYLQDHPHHEHLVQKPDGTYTIKVPRGEH